jgi:spermidine synthase
LKKRTPHLPEVNFSEDGRFRHLHLGTEWIQGSMQVDAPTALVHEYIQRMMAWLLFVEPASVSDRQALQLGLGAASLTKFCHKELRIKTAAIELNPQVLVACRGWFKLGADDARLQVVLAYSGGLDTSIILKWLKDTYNCEARLESCRGVRARS